MIPNEYQLAIWRHFRSDPRSLVVEALAGVGKTTTLVHGLEHLPFGNNVITTYGRDPIDDLKARIPPDAGARVQNLHGLGVTALRKYAKPKNREVDSDKVYRHAAEAIRAAGIFDSRGAVRSIVTTVKWCKDAMISTPADAAAVLRKFDIAIPLETKDTDVNVDTTKTAMLDDEAAGALIIDVLNRCARDLSCFDYDDMIWLCLVWGIPLGQYDNVLADEAQDFSPAQIQFTRQLIRPGGRLIAVGDRNQSIYSFRGADASAMTRIVEGFDAVTLPLPRNYRCARKIIEEAQKFVPEIEAAPDAPDGIVERISLKELPDMVDPGDFVISRSNAPLARIGPDLKMRGMKVVQIGRNVGDQYIDLIRKSRTADTDSLRVWLDEYLERRTKDLEKSADAHALEQVLDKVEVVKNYALGFDRSQEVVAYIKSVYADETREDAVILSSVHKAKGKEARRVFLIWATFLTRDTPEEKHIAYVGITRAKTELYFVEGDPYKI